MVLTRGTGGGNGQMVVKELNFQLQDEHTLRILVHRVVTVANNEYS